MGIKLMTGVQKKYIKSKGQCKDKCLKMYFPAQQWLQNTLLDIYVDLLSINFNLLSILALLALCLPLDQWFWNLHVTNYNIAKCIVLFNIISVVSDNILHICIQEPSWHLKDV